MDMFDFIEKQSEIENKIYGEDPPTYAHYSAILIEYTEELLDFEDLLEVTFNAEVPNALRETWINIAFLALGAAHRLGADRIKFAQAVQNILNLEPK
jgi:hypothetical protein